MAVALLCALLATSAASTAPRAGHAPAGATAVATERVVMGGDASYPPFSQLDREGNASGFDVELFRAAMHQVGGRADVRLGDWDAVIARLESGQVDVVPMLVTEERARRFLFSEPFLARSHRVFGRRGAPFVGDVAELSGRRVAVQRASMAWEALRHQPRIRFVFTDVEGDALLAVARGRADYAVVPLVIGLEARHRLRLQDVVSLSPPLLERDYAFAVARGREDLVARLNTGLRLAGQHGDWNRLHARWLATPSHDASRLGLTQGVWLAVLLLALGFLVAWHQARRHARQQAQLRRLAEEQRDHQTLRDPVTNLGNRQALGRAMERLMASGQEFALIRVDLPDTESIEAIAGHAFVDAMLATIAERLSSGLERALIAKVGHSSFLIAWPHIRDADGAVAAMRAIAPLVNSRGVVADIALEQRCSLGAALHPEHAAGADELMRAASAACAAGRHLPERLAVYSPGLAPDPRNLTLLGELKQAIREQTLGYALQPKVDLKTGTITGAEMLVRWQHPRHGLLMPAAFVPLAEERGAIGDMTLYLVASAVDLCRRARVHCPGFTMSVNISANDLCEADVVGTIIRMCEGIANGLMLEITETAVMKDAAAALEAALRLRAAGIGISLDDFGTGHSSLVYLRRLAPHEVKIDRSFVGGIQASYEDEAIVKAIIQLSHSLGARVVAEGVEDAKTLQWLTAARCDYAQGYLLGRPWTPTDLLAQLEEQAAPPAQFAKAAG